MEEHADSDRGATRTSRRVRDIEPQKIRVMFDLAAERGGDLVHLELGEPDFDTPEHVVEAACEAARGGATRYTSNAGILPLREALCERRRAESGREIDPHSEIAVTTGGVEALYLGILSVADPGDEVVIPTPAWPNPISQTELASAVPVEVPMPADEGFAPDADRIVDAIGPDTAAVVLTSPSNPTGQVFDEAAIERVADAAAAHGAYVIADEVYRELTYGDPAPSPVEVTDHEEHVLTVNSFSKTYAMTGWRVGWITGPAAVVEQVVKIHESTTSCVNTPAQHAALAALTGPQEPVAEMQAAFRRRRDHVVDRLGDVPHVSVAEPRGAFYAFVDVRALEGSSMAVAKRLLDEYGVVAAPGVAFGEGGEGHLRFSFANDLDRIDAGIDRFAEMIRTELGPA
jgi:aspartate aminotransferase